MPVGEILGRDKWGQAILISLVWNQEVRLGRCLSPFILACLWQYKIWI